ncbi:MAG: hypothetical protein JXQ72_11865 [Anaerolineae bacterium]|nr:hypothetical protein [Anaerolineae bacterium]
MRAAAATAHLARQAIQRGIEIARRKFLARLDILTAIPPVRLLRLLENFLAARFGLILIYLGGLLTGRLGQRFAFFS